MSRDPMRDNPIRDNPWGLPVADPISTEQQPSDDDEAMVHALVCAGIKADHSPHRHVVNLIHAASIILGCLSRNDDDADWEKLITSTADVFRKSANHYRCDLRKYDVKKDD